jgi:hypothetical protein
MNNIKPETSYFFEADGERTFEFIVDIHYASAIEEKITGYYADGKISDSHRQLLKEKNCRVLSNN